MIPWRKQEVWEAEATGYDLMVSSFDGAVTWSVTPIAAGGYGASGPASSIDEGKMHCEAALLSLAGRAS